ncbi:hypothetical protein D0T50_10760 [Bacteroides sp. 214]|nr:hypothetical protein [Bacteroides sp. 214]
MCLEEKTNGNAKRKLIIAFFAIMRRFCCYNDTFECVDIVLKIVLMIYIVQINNEVMYTEFLVLIQIIYVLIVWTSERYDIILLRIKME